MNHIEAPITRPEENQWLRQKYTQKMTSSPQLLCKKILKHGLDHIQFLTTCVQRLIQISRRTKKPFVQPKVSTLKLMSFGEKIIKENKFIYLFREPALTIHLRKFYRRG